MKTLYTYLTVAAFFLLLASPSVTVAQNSKIMDCKFLQTGAISLYVTDTTLISSIKYEVGESADSLNLFSTQYTLADFSNHGSVTNNILQTTLQNFTIPVFVKVTLLLENGQSEYIEVPSTN